MARAVVPQAEEILDKEFKVLDRGFVRLVDYMGDDNRIVQAARVSYGSGTKSYREDQGLINYLLRNGHTSPFEQVVFTFHIKLPIFVARQWVRHRTARLNEISGRYSVMEPEFYLPEVDDIAEQSSDNKQGRSDDPLPKEQGEALRTSMEEEQGRAYKTYKTLLDSNIARELARINLPLSLYTEWYWQIDLHNLFHFLKLRLHSHAQKEIRLYAETIQTLCQNVCPLSFEAFNNFIKGSVTFSSKEMEALQLLLKGESPSLSKREQEIFEAKLNEKREL